MNIDKNYFLDRLAAGENIDAIGQDVAKAMNEALEEHRAAEEAKKAAKEAKKAAAKAEDEAAKREIIEEMIELINEYAILEGLDPKELKATKEDIDTLVKSFTTLFAAMRDLKALVKEPIGAKTVAHITHDDDKILADFVSLFN